jgi:alpha-mannosidase
VVTQALLAALRARTFAEQVLEPAAHPNPVPLFAEVWRGALGQHPAEVAAQCTGWEAVAPGWRWGPAWSVAWFRLRGQVPEAAELPWLRFSSGTEALLWRGDQPWHGFDENRRWARLWPGAAQGGAVELLIEAHCNRPLGATTFFFDHPELHARWAEPRPGRFEGAALGRRDGLLWRLWQATLFAAELVEQLGDQSLRGKALQRALEDSRAVLEPERPARAAAESLRRLELALHGGAAPSASHCFPVGHAHLDTAWLWPTTVTRHKALRTFSTALATLESEPSFHFLCSQPQQYAWVEQDAPGLFARLREAVRAGRWEPLGAPWVEPDGNLPSGESFCRQLSHGIRAMEGWFGERGAQRLLYLPDSFGFCASLPQLARLAGLDTFVTNKLWWSETSSFPHTTFRWRGLDGSELLAHLTPGQDYNATLSAAELQRGERLTAERDRSGVDVWLQPYGFGDGGGGPTPEQALRLELARDCEGLPRLERGGARAFCEALHGAAREAEQRGTPLPVHDGELYLELHRGTWTSQSELKRRNARLEARLRALEARAALSGDGELAAAARAAWPAVLLNQFHDILPGSGTRAVVEEALALYDTVEARLSAAERRPSAADRVFFYPGTAAARVHLAQGDGQWASAQAPGLGFALLGDRVAGSAPSVDAERLTLDNGRLRATFDGAGRVLSLRRGDDPRTEVCVPGRPALELLLHDDRPRRWEAWDIDAEALERGQVLDAPVQRIEPLRGPHRAGLRFVRELGSGTRLVTEALLHTGSAALEVAFQIRWCEDRRLLRARFPVAARASHWTASVPFGHVERPTTRNTAAERARFETPIQRWMDLSEPGRGLTVLNDCRYGAAAEHDTLFLSLLRATRFPDPQADRSENGAEHHFRLALLPHGGDWRAAPVLDLAETLTFGAQLVAGAGAVPAPLFELEAGGPARALVSALCLAEDGERLLLRLVESHGARGAVDVHWLRSVSSVEAVDLLERPDARARLEHLPERTRLHLLPFQVVTLRLRREA